MYKKIALVVVIQFIISGFVFSQKFDIRVNAGTNLAFVPNYVNFIAIANDGMVVPGLIALNNSVTDPLFGYSTAITSPMIGFIADLEIRMKICDICSLSFAGGISKLKYTYDSNVDIEGTPNVMLGNLVSDFGITNLYYLNLRPLNFGITLFNNKVTLLAGATFNFFLNGKSNNKVVLYENPVVGEDVQKVDKLYVASLGSANSILYGIHLRVEYNIIHSLNVFVSSQYYFNSIYNTDNTKHSEFGSAKPTTVEVGVSFAFWRF